MAGSGTHRCARPHFDGDSVILVRLDRITVVDLDEVIVEAWLARAPKRLVKAYLD